jgi:hypothetical protein
MKVCSECQAVYDGRKWSASCPYPRQYPPKTNHTLCTGCKRIRDKVALGRVYLEGEVIATRPDEILRMIRREEEIEHAHNYCSRILNISSDGQKMFIQTVNSLLAIHIGKQLKKAYKGRMHIYKNTPGHRPRNKESEGTVAVIWTQRP